MIVLINLTGEKELVDRLTILASKCKNLSPLYKEIAKDWRSTMVKVFNTRGAFDGRQRWAPLDADYQEQKRKTFPGKPILVQTGKMRQSLIQKGHDHIEQVTDTTLVIGTRNVLASYHQNGSSKMPQRKLVEFTRPQMQRWIKIAEKFFKSHSKESL